MKTNTLIITLAMALSAATGFAAEGDTRPANPPGPRPGGSEGQQRHRPMPPILAALDANGDGTLSTEELNNASAALKSLDKNGDGQVTGEEFRGPRPQEGKPEGARPEGRPEGARPEGGRKPGADRPQRGPEGGPVCPSCGFKLPKPNHEGRPGGQERPHGERPGKDAPAAAPR